jgi:uncharacterized protein YfaS (alpha-2-macroglobulin family)
MRRFLMIVMAFLLFTPIATARVFYTQPTKRVLLPLWDIWNERTRLENPVPADDLEVFLVLHPEQSLIDGQDLDLLERVLLKFIKVSKGKSLLRQPVDYQYRQNARWVADAGSLPAGLYWINSQKYEEVRGYVLVSDLHLQIKHNGRRLSTFTTRKTDGKPLAAQIWITEENRIDTLKTDWNGIAQTQLFTKQDDFFEVSARSGNHWAFARASIARWNYSPTFGELDPITARVLLITDRRLYKVGDTVHWKATALDAKTLRPMVNKLIALWGVRSEDSEGKYAAYTNEFGVAFGQFRLSKETPRGKMLVSAEVGDEMACLSEKGCLGNSTLIEIQDYRKPEVQIQIQPLQTRVARGTDIQAKLEVRGLFRSASLQAKVVWQVLTDPAMNYQTQEIEYRTILAEG